MNARDTRMAIRKGEIILTVTESSIPKPPRTIPRWRRERLAVAIRCAGLFLFRDYTWEEIRDDIGRDRLFEKRKPSKARVCQYINRGVQHMYVNGVFKKTGVQ